jgi:hypothetical protein
LSAVFVYACRIRCRAVSVTHGRHFVGDFADVVEPVGAA